MKMRDIIAAICMGAGLFLLFKGLADPILMGPGGGLLLFGAALHHGATIKRAIGAGLLSCAGAFWLPGVIADPEKYMLLGLIAFVLIGTAIRVGLLYTPKIKRTWP